MKRPRRTLSRGDPPLKITHIVAARPNFMKAAPVIAALDGRPGVTQFLVHTGQHYDEEMSRIFFHDLGIPRPDIDLGIGSGSHTEQVARVLLALEPVLEESPPDLVVVVGDVNSTLASALTAVRLGIPVAHVEAGLRSRDRTMPEEINRLLTDQISEFLFTTERDAVENLVAEGIDPAKIHFVGNVMIDSLMKHRDRALGLDISRRLGLAGGGYALMTLHRPSNVDRRENLERILTAVDAIQRRLPLIFPVHPRTRDRLESFGLAPQLRAMKGVQILEPLGYLDFLHLQAGARVILTDSGGIQEESTILGIPCLTLRDNTERPITVTEGTNTIVGGDPARIVGEMEAILAGRGKAGRRPELWDGNAAQRIADVLVAVHG